MKTKLFLLTVIFLTLFTYFSYTVAKERWQQTDFDTTVKLQDHLPRKYDEVFSYFSILGSFEVIIGLCLILSFLSLLKGRWLAIFGYLIVIPASMMEIFGKLVLFHPAPPVFLHRSIIPTTLPSFYIHTDFSYPSGHMIRTLFILTIFICMIFFSWKNFLSKSFTILSLLMVGFLMGLTRVYLGEHWLSDVLGGVFLGVAFGCFASLLILRQKKV